MQIKQALQWGGARLDAELLLAHVLGRPVTFLLAHDETEIGWWALWRYRRLIAKRKEGMPVAYLTGHKEFYFLDFEVNRHVLVPRPDTEILAEAVISYIQENRKQCAAEGNGLILLDVGTGSGCIAISAVKMVEGLIAMATDISRSALRMARRNARRHGVADRIEFIQSDLLAGLPLGRLKKYDVIVTANLPYIPHDFAVNPEIKFEPQSSLYGGQDGMEVYKRLAEELGALQPRAIFLECFDFQKAILVQHLPGYELRQTQPLTGQARMLILAPAGVSL